VRAGEGGEGRLRGGAAAPRSAAQLRGPIDAAAAAALGLGLFVRDSS
jgi:hypothetical protein